MSLQISGIETSGVKLSRQPSTKAVDAVISLKICKLNCPFDDVYTWNKTYFIMVWLKRIVCNSVYAPNFEKIDGAYCF